MKVTIDKNIPSLSEEEAEVLEATIPESSMSEMKETLLEAKEIRISPQVLEFITNEMNMTPDEFVAMLLKEAGAQQ